MNYKEDFFTKRKNIIPIIFTLIAIVLEILPFGAKLTFALDEGKTQEKLFSYFSMTPYGYANFMPFITAVLTCVLFILALIILIKDYARLKKAFKIIVIITFAVASASFAFMNFTVTASLISLMLAFSWLSAQLVYKT